MKYNIRCCSTLLFVSMLINAGCTSNNTPITDTVKEKTKDTSFDTFFDRFEKDSTFQFSRIEFPVKTTTIEDDDVKTFKLIKKSEWGYHNILADGSEKYIIKKIKISATRYCTAFSIEDTGVYVEYNFICRNGKWMLNNIVDSGD